MGVCSQSSGILKLSTFSAVIALILLIVGFASYKWSILDTEIHFTASGSTFLITLSYFVGLWQHCVCATLLGYESCACENIGSAPDWFNATRALTTIGFIGLTVGCIVSFASHCVTGSAKIVKQFVAGLLIGSGVMVISAIIVYGVESKNHFDRLFAGLEYISYVTDTSSSTRFGFSFVMSIIAAVICLVVSTPLLIYDISKAPEPNQASVQLGQTSTQVQIITVPQGSSYGYPGGMQQGPNVMMQHAGGPTPHGAVFYQSQPPSYDGIPQEKS